MGAKEEAKEKENTLDEQKEKSSANVSLYHMKEDEVVPGRNRSTEILTTIALLKVFGKF